jgi:RimJ/RimL family protein N-acetyltransferase
MMNKLPCLKTPKSVYKKIYGFHLEGEPASLRAINPRDHTDFERYKNIFKHPQVEEFMEKMGKNMTDTDLRKIMRIANDTIIFAIVDTTDANKRMRGWVQFVPDEKQRINRIKDLKNKSENEKYLIVEASFARYFGRKKKVKGLITSGVRQASLRLFEMEKIYAELNGKKPRKVIINAYASIKNIPSIKVLERAGFVNKAKMLYHNPKFKKYTKEEKDCYFRVG